MPPFLTPEWLEAVGKNYRTDPDSQNNLFKGLSLFLTFRNEADPKFGIEKDIYHTVHLIDGIRQPDSGFLSKEDAEKKSDFILAAPPAVWKKVIKKEAGFLSIVMTGKMKIEKGSGPEIMELASKGPAVVDYFNKVDTEWPDEMSPQRLREYQAKVAEFRQRLRV
jgi:putative sterol carrier protein